MVGDRDIEKETKMKRVSKQDWVSNEGSEP
jgi:hypothetical protein